MAGREIRAMKLSDIIHDIFHEDTVPLFQPSQPKQLNYSLYLGLAPRRHTISRKSYTLSETPPRTPTQS